MLGFLTLYLMIVSAGIVGATGYVVVHYWTRRELFLHVLPLAVSHCILYAVVAWRMNEIRVSIAAGVGIPPAGNAALWCVFAASLLTLAGLATLVLRHKKVEGA